MGKQATEEVGERAVKGTVVLFQRQMKDDGDTFAPRTNFAFVPGEGDPAMMAAKFIEGAKVVDNCSDRPDRCVRFTLLGYTLPSGQVVFVGDAGKELLRNQLVLAESRTKHLEGRCPRQQRSA